MNSCPVPGCNHYCEVLTNNHCREHHGMSKKEVFLEHGAIKKVIINGSAKKKNMALYIPMYKAN